MGSRTRQFLIVAAILTATALTTARGGNDTSSGSTRRAATNNAGSTRRDWLFAIQSQGPSTYDAKTGTLTLPTDLVNAFTDRPYRDTRLVDPAAFAGLFQNAGTDSFRKDPPNAVLSFWEDNTSSRAPRTVVCDITGHVSYDKPTSSLAIGLRILEPKGAALPSALYRASLFIDNAPTPCDNPDDQPSVEYFNELNFDGAITLNVQHNAVPNSYQVSITCPPRQSASFPPASLSISVATPDGSESSDCNSAQPFTIDATNLSLCDGQSMCTIVVTARNATTSAVYSSTKVKLYPSISSIFVPQLQAAAVPICGLAYPSLLQTSTKSESMNLTPFTTG